jgi:OmpA-OmpF porin, OOP family
MKRIIIIILYSVFVSNIVAQNLVPNPSFEDNHCCPSVYSMFYCIQDWAAPTKGTTDYYSSCELKHYTPIVRTPTNFFGHQVPANGIAYIGLYMYYHSDYREYALTKLHEPLEANEMYLLNFKVSLADTAGIAIRSFGVAFTDTVYKKMQFTNITDVAYYEMYLPDSSFIKDKKKWFEVHLKYKAKGGEQVLMIGNFKNNEATDTLQLHDEHIALEEQFDSYYYLDDVCLGIVRSGTSSCVNDSTSVVNRDSIYIDLENLTNSRQSKPKIGEIIILKNIYFDFDKAMLRDESEPELQKLHDLLLTFPTLEIVINGHTDSEGNDAYNLGLSEARALAVYSWLIQKGISSTRLDFKGYGEAQPIDTNETEIGKQTNRRVEFEVKNIFNN